MIAFAVKDPDEGWAQTLFTHTVFALAIVAGAELGHMLSFQGTTPVFWPVSGIYLAALMATEARRWPGLLLSALLANVALDVLCHASPLAASATFWVANTVEAVVGAWFLRALFGTPFRLDNLKGVVGLCALPALISMPACATIGAATIEAVLGGSYSSSWPVWWASHALGVIVAAPAVITGLTDRPKLSAFSPWRLVESVIVTSVFLVAVEVVFGMEGDSFGFILYPFLLWMALRFDAGGVSLASLVMTSFAVWNTIEGRGPFSSHPDYRVSLWLVQGFSAVSAVSFLVLAALVRERQATAVIVAENESRYRDLFDNMDEMVLSIRPDGKLLYANRAFREVLGYSEGEIPDLSLFQIVHPEDQAYCRTMFVRELTGEKLDAISFRVVTRAGGVIFVEGSSQFRLEDGRPVCTRSIFRDVTLRREHERRLEDYQRMLEEANAELQELATTDPLSGLKNRRAFREKLDEEFARATRYGAPLSVLLLDVDHFKKFNDAFGHPAGDEVLKKVARLLTDNARSTDFVARYGGEEFAVILPNADREGALVQAERCRQAIADAPWEQRGVTASFGVSTLGLAHEDGSSLISEADEALYLSKKEGRNCVHHAGALLSEVPA